MKHIHDGDVFILVLAFCFVGCSHFLAVCMVGLDDSVHPYLRCTHMVEICAISVHLHVMESHVGYTIMTEMCSSMFLRFASLDVVIFWHFAWLDLTISLISVSSLHTYG